MKTRSLKNYSSTVGVEAYDIDWNCQEELLELGKLCASQCIVFVDEKIPTETLCKSMLEWGDPSRAFVHDWVAEQRLTGSHWREILMNLVYIGESTSKIINNPIESDLHKASSIVSYKRGPKERPTGIFQNGELNWHSDQCAFDDGQRIIGLQSVSDTVNSQTQFLCTHDVFESLSSEMQSVVKELVVKHKWVDNVMTPGLSPIQTMIARYNMVPIDGMETNLYRETSTGLSGMKIPSHSFNGFVGMSMEESLRIMEEINKKVYNEKYIYTQDWQDGQIVFMDQEITLHKRPTNIQDGDKRTMARVSTYLNKLFNNEQSKRMEVIKHNGSVYTLDEFAKMVDEDRKKSSKQVKTI
jgi:alpha-ketoglutarate-dependent taurine dioxygenase